MKVKRTVQVSGERSAGGYDKMGRVDTEYPVDEQLVAGSRGVGDELERTSEPSSDRAALRAVTRPFWASRLLVLLLGVYASLAVGSGGVPITSLGRVLTAPSNHWDANWYLLIAHTGYKNPESRAFFPLYPLLVKVGGWVIGDVYAGVVISLVAFLVALFLLYRLVELDFGSEVARVTVALVAFCPLAFFFSAIYTESLFLALSVGAIYAARRERWLIAGLVGAFAAATRSSGVLLVLPIVLLYLYGPRGDASAPLARWHESRSGTRLLLPRYRLSWRVWPVILVPLGLVAFTVYLALAYHAGTSWISAESYWVHQSAIPIVAYVRGMSAGWSELRHLISHSSGPYASSQHVSNLLNAIAAIVGLVVLVECIRTLPAAYWVYAAAAFIVPLASPVAGYPLTSFPRYELVIFPLFIGVARYLVRKRQVRIGVASSAVLLGVFAVLFAVGNWIA